MKDSDDLIKVFTGTEVTVLLLQEMLEEIGIGSLIQNDYQLGVDVGFVGGVQSALDLFIQTSDFEKAEPVIREFISQNQQQAGDIGDEEE